MQKKADNMTKKVLKGKDLSKLMDLEDKIKKGSRSSNVEILDDNGAILNKKVLDAKEKAKRIIEAANKEADKVREEAENLLSQVKDEMEKAKEEGYKDGREEGLAGLTERATELEKVKEDFYKDAEANIIRLVMMVVEKVIGKIVHEQSEAINAIVTQAIESSIGERIVVRLNPEDHAKASDVRQFKDVLDRTKRITFKADDTIERGGCVVETEVGTIDARLETQLKAIRKALEL